MARRKLVVVEVLGRAVFNGLLQKTEYDFPLKLCIVACACSWPSCVIENVFILFYGCTYLWVSKNKLVLTKTIKIFWQKKFKNLIALSLNCYQIWVKMNEKVPRSLRKNIFNFPSACSCSVLKMNSDRLSFGNNRSK